MAYLIQQLHWMKSSSTSKPITQASCFNRQYIFLSVSGQFFIQWKQIFSCLNKTRQIWV